MRRRRSSGGRWGGDGGFAGGGEMLPFGLVVLVVGTLVVANGWAVIDARLVASSAAREAVRTYVETGSDGAGAWRAAEQAAAAVMVDAGRDPNRFRLEPVAVVRGALSRCVRVVVVASYEVPALTVPFVGGFADGTTVEARASEVVDPYRSGLSGGGCG